MLLLVPALIALNAFFVAAEYAVVAARPVHLAALTQRGHRRSAAAMERLKADPASAIGAIQVCITTTNLALGWIGEPALTQLLLIILGPIGRAIPHAIFRPMSIALAFLIVTLLTVVLSELLPKALTLRYVPAVVRFTAVPMSMIRTAVTPLVWLMNKMANLVTLPLGLGRVDAAEPGKASVQELRLLATEAAAEGKLTDAERTLILNTLALNHRLVKRIMVPRPQVQHLDLRWSMDANRKVVETHLHTRYPLCDGGLDHIVGVVKTKQFLTALAAEAEVPVLQLIADDPLFAPEISTLGQMLGQFSEKKAEFAMLVDEYGAVAGLITLGDIVDDLFGAIDESKALLAEAKQADLTEPYGEGGGPQVRVIRGDLAVHELGRLMDMPDWGEGEESATVAGVIQAHLGDIGDIGSEIDIDGLKLKIIESDGRSIGRVEVRRSGG